ncbi:hypothetical protein BJX66DRAFT_344021 [Aspergillus keveii]|uniref:Uncharacterized protein n=1 Tax=Aspergillus keveii TaxID=714993 RepID=A0ABR4FMI1_9EURO
MRYPNESAQHASNREAVRSLALRVFNHEPLTYPVEQLPAFDIRFEEMDVKEITAKGPLFSHRFLKAHCSVPKTMVLANPMNILHYLTDSIPYSFHLTLENFAFEWRYSDETPFSGLEEHGRKRTVFACFNVGVSTDSFFPHVKLRIQDTEVATDDVLLRGELLPIQRAILTRMRQKNHMHHLLTLVLAFSVAGLSFRIIEAFFQDGSLVIRATKLFNMEERNDEATQFLAQWYLGGHAGVTTEK